MKYVILANKTINAGPISSNLSVGLLKYNGVT